MSRASDYAERVKAAQERPSWTNPITLHPWLARATNEGKLEFLSAMTLNLDDALALAAWIVETFGEPPPKQEPVPPEYEEIFQKDLGDILA